uniref:Uncharacterized protein n=1 Tax=Anguilla anguilla TaxID=7936 RepID=A0A0E9UYC7_ANGAN
MSYHLSERDAMQRKFENSSRSLTEVSCLCENL